MASVLVLAGLLGGCESEAPVVASLTVDGSIDYPGWVGGDFIVEVTDRSGTVVASQTFTGGASVGFSASIAANSGLHMVRAWNDSTPDGLLDPTVEAMVARVFDAQDASILGAVLPLETYHSISGTIWDSYWTVGNFLVVATVQATATPVYLATSSGTAFGAPYEVWVPANSGSISIS